MTQEELDRIAELEGLLEMGEELDEDDRTELRELRQAQRSKNRQSKAMAAWEKAKEVYLLSIDDDDSPTYALTPKVFDEMATMYGWPTGDWSVDKVERPSLGRVAYDSYQKIYWDGEADSQ
jgi:hypothetical protein